MLQQAVETQASVDASNGGPGLSLSDLFRMLVKRSRFILVMGIACGLAAFLYATLTKPVYESSATLRIDSSRAGSLGVSDPAAPNVQDDSEIIKTEMGVMKSESVALGVLITLPPDEFQKATGFAKSATTVPSSSASPAARSLAQEKALQSFESKVAVKQIEGTQFITVGVSNSDASIAADLANRLVASFQVQSIASRDASVAQLRSYLTAQIQTMRAQVNVDQKHLADFQEANSILGTQGESNTVADRLKSLNDHLASADADRIEKEGQLRAAERGDAATLGSLFPNPKLNELQSQQGELYTKYAQLSAKFGAKYPPLIEIKRQLDIIDGEMSRNADAVRGRLRQEYQGAADVQKMFQREYDEQIAAAYAVNRNQAEYARLLAEVTSGRELADSLQHKLDQAVVDAQVSGINVMPIDAAHPPTTSAGPKKRVIILGVDTGAGDAAGTPVWRGRSLSKHPKPPAFRINR
jgi:succinoglycan biosynthesis transport protein ExoP